MAAEGIEISREQGESSGRYRLTDAAGSTVGELVYRRPSADLLVATHTEVNPAYRGQGLAGLLVDRLIADARAEGSKIRPLCSYVRSQFDEHPEWQDLRAP